MAMTVAPVKNATLNQSAPVNQPNISGVITATPGSNGFAGLEQPSAPAATGGGGGGAAAPVVDPYAAWGGLAGYQKAVADYGAQKNSTMGSITDRIGSEGDAYGGSVTDFIENLGAGQGKITSKSVQNELAREQGTSGILGMLGRGIRSGGVMLANKNASTSSATDALARAYSDIGRREQTGVNNQFEQGNNSIAEDQSALDLQRSQGIRHFGENKTKVINGIVSDAQTALATLNQSASSASLPDRIDIEAEKQRIRNEAMTKLQAYDEALSRGLAGINPADSATIKTRASLLDHAGTAAENAFSFNANTPAQFQGTGPFASELPLFTLNKKTGF